MTQNPIQLSALSTKQLDYVIDNSSLLSNVSAHFPAGKITALVGPNGSGKSTLLKLLAKALEPTSGCVYIDGDELKHCSLKKLAHKLSFLPQGMPSAGNLTVRSLVACGRYPHHGLFKKFSEKDEQAVNEALALTSLEELSERTIDTLSGGQKQRAFIALCLAQQTQVLLLDEPTTYLDVRHQIDILNLLHDLNLSKKITIIWVLHDLNHAARFSDHLVMIRDGQVVSEGPPEAVMTKPLIKKVFELEVQIITHPQAGTPVYIW